jgi:hypothetical protein
MYMWVRYSGKGAGMCRECGVLLWDSDHVYLMLSISRLIGADDMEILGHEATRFTEINGNEILSFYFYHFYNEMFTMKFM